MDQTNWKLEMPSFIEKTDAFYAGEVKPNDYKGFSGFYGSYAQKGAKASMLRLRMSAGRLTKEKLKYVVDMAEKYHVDPIHFTTCQAIQFHNLNKEAVYDVMEHALDVGIITFGGGGDFPRNVMCSPLSGVEVGEYFDVMPYALAAADYLVGFIKAEKMPRKLKVCFSNSKANAPHATFRDLGFVAREDGKFDVYSAGGLGNNPKFGVKVAEAIDPNDILYYIKAMWLTFRAYGNYELRAKARTRYMQEALGGAENYKKAYLEKLEAVKGENLKLNIQPTPVVKAGDGTISGKHIYAQKQPGLYAVNYHPAGGKPSFESLKNIYETIKDIKDVEMRLTPDEGSYIINLTASEAKKVLEACEKDNANTLFETSVSCIGATICQVGLRDSQGLLNACIQAVKEAGIKDGALPQIHISGCPSSCGSHQTNILSFRGGIKIVDKKPVPGSAFLLYVGGNAKQGEEKMAEELGAILESQIPEFLIKVGRAVEASGKTYEDWYQENPEAIKAIAAPYLA